ncbi:MAG TPA: Rne/Rng family ribonuclease [Candidatus Sulfotelmatobacter sp.]|nr:Rne/Rng family ribonuclease [Candidatus Sulfotelmatobacter sp.]
MSKEMVISANPHETRVAILEEGQLCEYYVEREKEFALVGSIYKGKVTRVLPGMQSAFVEIGLDSDAFLYVSDFLEDIEDFDHIVTTVEEKAQKMEAQGGQVFAAPGATAPSLEPIDVEAVPFLAEDASHSEFAGSEPLPLAPTVTQHVPSHAPPPSRPRFENRSPGGHGGDRGGRNFRGRGGRGGGRNFRRDSGGRGGERRPGRELPSSKYASPRPYEENSTEPATAEGHVSIILPGESLAKYREKPAAPASSSVEPVENLASTTSEAPSAQLAPEPFETQPNNYEPPAQTSRATYTESPDPSARLAAPVFPARRSPSSSSGLEPLPGEKLSKWKAHQHLPIEPKEDIDALPVPDAVRFAPLAPLSPLEQTESEAPPTHDSHEPHDSRAEQEPSADRETHFGRESIETVHTHTDHLPSDLSEDEVTALAEHIAEAQDDAAARVAQERVFAAADAAAEGHGTEADAEAEAEEIDAAEEEAEEEVEHEGSHLASSEHEHTEEEHGRDEHPDHVDHLDSEHSEHAEHLDSEAQPPVNDLSMSAENPRAISQPPTQARVRNDFRSRMQNPARRGQRDRGRRDDRNRRPQHSQGHHRPQQPRRTQLIADMLKQGQEIIVQIAKEPLGKKGARITSHIALPGRFLVYMPTLDHTGVSRKIASAEERSRLRHLVNDAKGTAGGGFIVRTAASSAAPEEVRADVEFLTRTWSEIKARSEQRKAPSILHRDLNLVERILRDYITPDFGAIWVDTEEEYTKVVDFMSRFQPQLVGRVKLYTKETPVFEEFGIQQEIDKGLRPKVWLKSGGYIVINHTEALVAIDVNTGKFVGKGSNRLEDTIVRTNLEAVKEIVRQMRLRDLGGIIIIDFIDMEERRNREKVMAALEDSLRADRAPSKVLRFNEFGLVAITRKRTKQALERTLCQPCPYCTGSGMVKSVPTLCYEIQTEARKMAPEVSSGSLTLRVHPEISKALKTRESELMEELERWTKKSIIIQADPTLHWEQYDIY